MFAQRSAVPPFIPMTAGRLYVVGTASKADSPKSRPRLPAVAIPAVFAAGSAVSYNAHRKETLAASADRRRSS
jgi:hypothetical protein